MPDFYRSRPCYLPNPELTIWHLAHGGASSGGKFGAASVVSATLLARLRARKRTSFMAPGDLSAVDLEGVRTGAIGDPTVRQVAALAAGVGDRRSVRMFRRR